MKIVYQVVDPGLRPGSAYVEVDNQPRYLHDRIEVDTDTTDPTVLRVLEGLPISLLERGIVTRIIPGKTQAVEPPKGDNE